MEDCPSPFQYDARGLFVETEGLETAAGGAWTHLPVDDGAVHYVIL
jgi:hypothetical protein